MTHIDKPANDDREYKLITLANKLQVLLISDPATEKAAAAMDVNVGHFCDPEEAAGLAHFCEHMLFLGTAKYPEEGSYQAFLKKHGGSSNAYTDTQNTNYYFDVTSPHLEAALDRFAQFFISPLFTENATEREMNAVDSENKKNLQTDSWRVYQLLKSTSNPAHPFSKFGTGNLETLNEGPTKAGINVRQLLLDFHQKYYSANVMRLVVLGAEPIETLEQWVAEKFVAVTNTDAAAPTWSDFPFSPEQLKVKYHIVPIKDLRSLTLYFQVREDHTGYLSKVSRYASHLIGHEGPGSAFSHLKTKGWLNSLSAGTSYKTREFSLFSISMDMTEQGEEHIDEIIGFIFQYIKMVQSAGIQKWIWEECADLAALQFRFKEKSEPMSYVSVLANNMHKYQAKHVISGAYLFFEYDEHELADFLTLLKPENARIHIVSKRWAGTTSETEKWYHTEYSVVPLGDDTIQPWKTANVAPELYLPSPNPFIPKNFDICPFRTFEGVESEAPQLVINTNFTKLWFKQDRTFKQPKANIYLSLVLPLTYSSPKTIVLARLFTRLVADSLNEYAYDAEVAGIGYDVSAGSDGIQLALTGYNDKIAVLTQKVFEKVKNIELQGERFELIKERLLRQYKNFAKDQPYQHAMDRTSVLLLQQRWNYEEYIAVIPDISFRDLERFVPLWLGQIHVEGLMHGNLTQETALTIMADIERVLFPGATMVLESQQFEERIIALKDKTEYYHELTEPNVDNANSALEVIYQIGVRTQREDILLDLLQTIVSSPFYELLRTKEQLGYLVWSRIRRDGNAQFWTGLIQSPNASPIKIAERIELFLIEFRQTLVDLPAADFQQFVQSLIARKLEKPKELAKETAIYWREIARNTYRFDREHHEAKELKELTKEDLLQFFDKYIAADGEQRRRMSVMVFAKQHEEEMLKNTLALDENGFKQGHNKIYIRDPARFKRDMPLLPSSHNY